MTPNGYKQIENEIEQLKLDRPAKIKQLQEARALGDLSENAEYSAAKRDLRHLESRLRYLNKQLQYAEIITPKNADSVDIGTTVTIQFDDDENDLETYQIVGAAEADPLNGKISNESPIAKGLVGHKKGEKVTVTTPGGEMTVTIIDVK